MNRQKGRVSNEEEWVVQLEHPLSHRAMSGSIASYTMHGEPDASVPSLSSGSGRTVCAFKVSKRREEMRNDFYMFGKDRRCGFASCHLRPQWIPGTTKEEQ